jgi:hypothetical protein
MKLNLQNIEDIFFMDKKIQRLFPEFQHYFDQWLVSKRVPGMQTLGKKTLLDTLNSLETIHLDKLREYFNCEIILEKIDYHIVKNKEFTLDNMSELCEFADYTDFCVTRTDQKVEVTFWR